MRLLFKAALGAALLMSIELAMAAQVGEAPPREPPYISDSEFDSVSENEPLRASKSVTPSVPGSGVRYLHHPDAKKGLIRIEQDGTYVYKVKMKKSTETGIFKAGVMAPPQITAADGIHNFAGMYGDGYLPAFFMEYEWQPFSKYGKLGVQGGLGLAMAEGNGYFINDPLTVPQESYTFIVVPLSLGLVYRLEYFKRQWVAPYLSGGGTYIGVAELRDDNENNFSGTPAAYGSAGLMFNISAADRLLAFNLSSEYGIANLWLIADFRYQYAFSEDLDFTGDILTLGIGVDF